MAVLRRGFGVRSEVARGLVSTLKCNTQLFVNAEVARPVKISTGNIQKHLGGGTGFPPVHKRSRAVLHLLVESALPNSGMHPTPATKFFMHLAQGRG